MSRLAPPQVKSTVAAPVRANAARTRVQRKKRTTHWSSPVVLENTAPPGIQRAIEPTAPPVIQRALEVSEPEYAEEQEAEAVAEQVMRKEETAAGSDDDENGKSATLRGLGGGCPGCGVQRQEDDSAPIDDSTFGVQRQEDDSAPIDDSTFGVQRQEDDSAPVDDGTFGIQRQEDDTSSIDEGAFGASTSLFGEETLQTKLVVGSVDDPLEREADEVAERVMRMADPDIGGSLEHKDAVQRAPTDDEDVSTVRRAPTNDEDEPLRGLGGSCAGCGVQRKEADDENRPNAKLQYDPVVLGVKHVPAPVAESIAALRRDGGTPLPRFVRQDFERRFQHDFSQVRVHTGEGPATVAKQLRAKAFTLGRDVVFGQGRFQPETDSGKRLLAHELTHVVQQRGAPLAAHNVAQRDEEDQEETVEEPPVDRWKGTLVDEVLLSVANKRVAFRTAKGTIFGTVQKLDIAPGTYRLTPSPKDQTWAISGEGVKSGLRFNVDLGSVDPWSLSYPNELSLTVVRNGNLDSFTEPDSSTFGATLNGLEDLYRKYREYQAVQFAGNVARAATPAAAGGVNLAANHDLRAQTLENELVTGLAAKGIASIEDFATLITTFEAEFRGATVKFAYDTLDRYEQDLEQDQKRYSSGTSAQDVHASVSQAAKPHYDEERAQTRAGLLNRRSPVVAWETNVPIAPQYKSAADEAHNRGEQAALKAAAGHPLISKRDFNRQGFAEASSDNAASLIVDYIRARKKDIATIRKELTDPDFVWNPSLGDLRAQSYRSLGIVPDSIHDLIVRDRVAAQERRVFLTNLALAVLAAALTAVSLGLGAGAFAVASGVTAGVISGSQAYATYVEYESSAAAYHTGFSADDPSVIWVIVAVVGAGLDIATVAVPILRTLRPLVSRFISNPARNLFQFEAEIARLSDGDLPPSIRQRVLDAARKEASSPQERELRIAADNPPSSLETRSPLDNRLNGGRYRNTTNKPITPNTELAPSVRPPNGTLSRAAPAQPSPIESIEPLANKELAPQLLSTDTPFVDRLGNAVHSMLERNIAPETQARVDAFVARMTPSFKRIEYARNNTSLLSVEQRATLARSEAEIDALRAGPSNTSRADSLALERWHDAAQRVRTWADAGEPLTLDRIKEINQVLETGTPNEAFAGQLRQVDVSAGGTATRMYLPSTHVEAEMAEFCRWYNANQGTMNPVQLAAQSYQRLISIHPFRDANGRTTRLTMDYILRSNGIPEAVFAPGEHNVAVFALESMFNPKATVTPDEVTERLIDAITRTIERMPESIRGPLPPPR